MRNKILFLLVVLVLGTALTACGPTTLVAESQTPQRTMNVTGSGMVTLTPDIAYINIGVHTENASAAEAVAENNSKAQAVSEAIKAFGVEAKDIQTTNFSVYPQPQYDDKSVLTGIIFYVVDNTVYVTVRDLKKLGDLLDAAIQAGANNINGISFDVADKTEALSQARLAAVANAQKQAQEIASAAGVSLGEVQTISFYDSVPTPYMDYGKGGGAMNGVSVSPGQMVLTTSVTITYLLK